MRKKIYIYLLSFIYTLFIVVGNSFYQGNGFEYIEKNIILNLFISLILYIIIYFIIKLLFKKIENKSKKKYKIIEKIKTLKLYKLFRNHPFLFSLIFILIFWIPYIISFYPAILSPDPSFQIKQYFNIPNKYSSYVVMIDPNILITNHHPVIHTLLLGSCVKIGTLINNTNIGLFIYSLIQIMILSSVLAYTIKFMNEIKIRKEYLLLTLIIYSLVPIFPFYAMSSVKDVIFTSLIILYIIFLYKIIKSDDIKIKNMIKIIILLIFIILFRNNGIHTIILSFPFLFFINKNKKKILKLVIIFLTIILFNLSYNKKILPYFKITPTSVREILSIPFQQTARYVKKYDKKIPEEEKRIIDKLLKYDTLKDRYKTDISDPVKNEFNPYYTNKDLNNYFNVWFKELKKDPKVYIEATIDNTYGYFYPLKTRWYIYYKYNDIINEDGFNYHYNSFNNSRKILSNYGKIFMYIPFVGLIINIGFNVWILIFMFIYLIYRKKYKEMIYLFPSLVLVLVCIASPVNAYFRYALPYVSALMLNFGIFMREVYYER